MALGLPFGEFFHGDYYVDDQYGDHHPVFNVSELASIRVTMSEADFNHMLGTRLLRTYKSLNLKVFWMYSQHLFLFSIIGTSSVHCTRLLQALSHPPLEPLNLITSNYTSASIYFQNSYIRETVSTAGIRIKGYFGGRLGPKKAFKLKFDTIPGTLWRGLKSLGLKIGTSLSTSNLNLLTNRQVVILLPPQPAVGVASFSTSGLGPLFLPVFIQNSF